jgi:general secretion pathway protein D
MARLSVGLITITLATASFVAAQVGGPSPSRIASPVPPPAPAQPAAPQQVNPAPNAPATPNAAAPAPAQAAQPQNGAPAAAPRLTENGALMMNNVSLSELLDALAKQLKINYILDPRVKGSVTIYTYGEVKPVDLMQLLETILRVNGAAMVKVGDLYRIVPVQSVSQLPLDPVMNADPKTLPDDERMVLNMIFLKYTTAADMDKVIAPFLGEGASHSVYEPGNLIILQDNSRNMRRTMELIALFDSDTFAGQRVKLYDVEHSRPSDLVKELDTVFKAFALSDKTAIKFIPIDRINTLIAVSPNPGVFSQVGEWIEKLDVPVKTVAGGLNNYVYRMRYGRAETMAAAIMALYTGNASALMSMASAANSAMVANGMGMSSAPGGAGFGGYGGFGGGAGGGAYGQGYASAYGNTPVTYNAPISNAVNTALPGAPVGPAGGARTDLTGSFLGAAGAAQPGSGLPGVIPNPFDNTLLIRATPQEYEQIQNLLRSIDVPPRQVLIDAKIYEVDLTADTAAGVETYLQQIGSAAATSVGGALPGVPSPSTTLAAVAGAGIGGVGLTTGALVLKSHELLMAITATDSKTKGRVISSPSIIATDSIPATMNVGSQVPTLASQAVAGGVQSGGSSVFTNTINNQSSGTTLSILARVNSSGAVTMVINQQVSSPVPPAPSASIQSPSFTNRSVSTQMTVQDGDTVAIGGIITENHTESVGGVPLLDRIPVVGTLFGSRTIHTDRTELIIFLTPRVIFDTNQLQDATDEIKSSLKRVAKLMKDQ